MPYLISLNQEQPMVLNSSIAGSIVRRIAALAEVSTRRQGRGRQVFRRRALLPRGRMLRCLVPEVKA